MRLVETKLPDGTDFFNIRDGDYSVWFRNRARKQGEDVMLLVKEDLLVDSALYKEGKAEILKTIIGRNIGRNT